jgi:hypothetical protein
LSSSRASRTYSTSGHDSHRSRPTQPTRRGCRPAVKTSPFHPGNRGGLPPRPLPKARNHGLHAPDGLNDSAPNPRSRAIQGRSGPDRSQERRMTTLGVNFKPEGERGTGARLAIAGDTTAPERPAEGRPRGIPKVPVGDRHDVLSTVWPRTGTATYPPSPANIPTRPPPPGCLSLLRRPARSSIATPDSAGSTGAEPNGTVCLALRHRVSEQLSMDRFEPCAPPSSHDRRRCYRPKFLSTVISESGH